MNDQQQMMQQLLAYLEKQMEGSQQNMADLPQRALQAGATPTQGSGGTILSPDPVRRVQQANEAWRERFPNPVENAARLGMTPEALLASRGNDATNQWAQLGGVVGVDPQKQRDMNRAASQYAAFAKSQREGTTELRLKYRPLNTCQELAIVPVNLALARLPQMELAQLLVLTALLQWGRKTLKWPRHLLRKLR